MELLHREWGCRGFSFDGIPNTDVNDRLFAVSKGIKERQVGARIMLILSLGNG
jgi:hypothetical protein